MLHARLFKETAAFRDQYFQPTKDSLVSKEKSTSPAWLDGNPENDRPLFVQFCANKPEDLLEAAQYVAPYCDAVDLNLGCPQGIARSGHYGAFLQEDWETIYKMINKLHNELPIPVTAKMRILENKEKTLEYAKMILSAGASILTVHGRRREQKGHNTGLADWSIIRYLRDNLPPETVIFANGNILNSSDLEPCLVATGADGIMSAEGNLSDPTIFAKPPKEYNPREYWYGPDGEGGYRMDGVLRRYLDIIYKYCFEKQPPQRPPLYLPGDSFTTEALKTASPSNETHAQITKRQKRKNQPRSDPNLKAIQGHLFQLLRPLLSKHTDIRDALAQSRARDIESFEQILTMVESVVKSALDEDAAKARIENEAAVSTCSAEAAVKHIEMTPKQKTESKYKRPCWVCQPYIRPLPEEAIQLGSLQLSKKEKAKREMNGTAISTTNEAIKATDLADEAQLLSMPISKQLPEPTLVYG